MSTITTPTVSIIIPVYNRATLLPRALSSVAAQTFQKWECIIIDDGSTDNSVDMATKYIAQDSRFILLKRPHKSNVEALNSGLRIAHCTYVAFLDSDDEYLSNHVELRFNELEQYPEVDLLYGGLKVVGDEMVLDKNDLTKKISLYDPNVYVGGTFFGKRTVFSKLNGFRKMAYSADSDFMERAMKEFMVKKVVWPTYIYHRDHQDSMTKNIERLYNKS